MDSICAQNLWCKLFETQNPIANLRQKTCRNAAGRARGHYGAGSALQEPHTARPDLLSVGMASTNPRGGSMGLRGPPCAVLSPLVADPPDAPGDPESRRIKSITHVSPYFPGELRCAKSGPPSQPESRGSANLNRPSGTNPEGTSVSLTIKKRESHFLFCTPHPCPEWGVSLYFEKCLPAFCVVGGIDCVRDSKVGTP